MVFANSNYLYQSAIIKCHFFLFSSPETKAQVSFSEHNLSVVVVDVIVVDFSHFHLFIKNH